MPQPLKYSFAKMKTGLAHRGGFKKLHLIEIREIRQWAQGEGAGMPPMLQAECLMQRYPGVKVRTLYDVVMNLSWFDPTYDPAAVVPPTPVQISTMLVSMPWLLTLLLMWQMLITPASATTRLEPAA